MTSLFVYVISVAIAFYIGRMSYKTPIPLSFSELSELRKDKNWNVHHRIAKGKERIIEYTRKQKRITNEEVQEMLLVSSSTAWRYLEELEREGILRQRGDLGSEVYYELN